MTQREEISLKCPSIEYKDTFLKWLSEAHTEETYKFWDFGEIKNDFKKFVDSQLAKEIMCPIGKVPESVFWIFSKNIMVGRISVRHELTDELKQKGGHIGYQISNSYRGRGFATKALKLALIEAKNLGLTKVLLTTDRENFASQTVILKNSGKKISDPKQLRTGELLKFNILLDHGQSIKVL